MSPCVRPTLLLLVITLAESPWLSPHNTGPREHALKRRGVVPLRWRTCGALARCGPGRPRPPLWLVPLRLDVSPNCQQASASNFSFVYCSPRCTLFSHGRHKYSTLPSPTLPPPPPRAFHQHHSAPPPVARACCYRPSYLLHPSGAPHQASSPRLPAHSQPPPRWAAPPRRCVDTPSRQRPWNWSGRTSMVRLPKTLSLKSWMALAASRVVPKST